MKKSKLFPVSPKIEDIHCAGCKKTPEEISEYKDSAEDYNITPLEFVKQEEGTYCNYTGLFLCTECYVKSGFPLNEKLHEDFIYYRMEHPIDGQNREELIKYRLGLI